jgi:hypothetical protein
MLLAGSMLPAINTRKHVPMPASRGQFIHRNYYPLYIRVAGGINSDVVSVGRLKRRFKLRPIRELDISTQRLVYRLARRLDLIRSFVLYKLFTGGLVGRGLVVVALLFARGLVTGSFVVNNSESRSL